MKKIIVSVGSILVLVVLIITLLIIGAVISCPSELVEESDTCGVQVLQQSEQELTFRVWSYWSNTSGNFSHFEVERDGFNYSIKMFGKCTKPCGGGEALTEISGDLTIEVPEPGSYHFSFCKECSYIESAEVILDICPLNILFEEELEE